MIKLVAISSRARKEISKLPRPIQIKLQSWVEAVKERGVEKVRKQPGYHDEPLSGTRKGQRSIRLNRSYRAIYSKRADDTIEFLMIEEVNKHDY